MSARTATGPAPDAPRDAGEASPAGVASEGRATPGSGAEADPVQRALAALDAAAAGPLVLHADRTRGRAIGRSLATALGTRLETVAADAIGLTGDPVGDLHSALRDAMHLRVRLMRKVFEGRVQSVKPLGPDPGAAARRLPPAQLELTLATDEDVRTLRLEGAFAAAFHATGARTGDVIQMDREIPLVALRPGREPEGRVLEERDFVYHVRLGDRDRSHEAEPVAAAAATGDDEATDRAPKRQARPVAVARPLLATGRHGNASTEAMRATDRWVDEQLGGKGTRLEAAVLLIEDADALDDVALVALREAIRSPASPIVILQSEAAATAEHWQHWFDAAVRLDRQGPEGR